MPSGSRQKNMVIILLAPSLPACFITVHLVLYYSALLQCIAQCFITVQYTVFYYSALHSALLQCIAQCFIAVYCTVLYYSALHSVLFIKLLLLKKRLAMQGWEREIATLSVRRPQPHTTNL